jgi:hypothetical protein
MKTVTGLFDTHADAVSAVRDLENMGIPSQDISIISHHVEGETSDAAEGAGTGAGVGAAIGGAGGLLAGLGLMAIPGVGPVVAAGWLASTAVGVIAGAVAGGAAGGIIGALTGEGVPEADAHVYAEGVRRGGSLVTARVNDVHEAEATAILRRGAWVDPVERRRAYEAEGWAAFDENLPLYTTEEIDRERGRYRV